MGKNTSLQHAPKSVLEHSLQELFTLGKRRAQIAVNLEEGEDLEKDEVG